MLAQILLLALALSIDALGVGISYGLRRMRVHPVSLVILLSLSMLFSFLAVLAGRGLAALLPPLVSQLLGALVLVAIGVWVIVGAGKERKKPESTPKEGGTICRFIIRSLGLTIEIIRNPVSCDFDRSERIEPLEAVYLGIALSVDALGAGIGTAVAGINSYLIPVAVGVMQLLLLMAGLLLGRKAATAGKIGDRVWNMMSGSLLIVLAVLRLVF